MINLCKYGKEVERLIIMVLGEMKKKKEKKKQSGVESLYIRVSAAKC